MKVISKNTSGVGFQQIKNIVSNDDLRPVLCGVHINITEKRLEATDAHCLLMYPIEIVEKSEDFTNKIVPARFFNVLKYMEEVPKKYIELLEYVLTDEFAEIYFGVNLVFRCRYIDGTYPDVNKVIPNEKTKKEPTEVIGFNSIVFEKFLKGFPKCFPNNLSFQFYTKNTGVFVKSNNLDEPIVSGMIMPIRLDLED